LADSIFLRQSFCLTCKLSLDEEVLLLMVNPHESSSAVSVARGLLLLLQLEVGFLTELERV
jgi:hypothetical protein